MISTSPPSYHWKVVKEEADGRWRVSRFASNDFLESNPVESHYFLTPEFAGIMLRFCQNIEKPSVLYYTTNSVFASNGMIGGFLTVANNSLPNGSVRVTTAIKLSGRIVVEIDQNNNLVTFDLPFLVLQWLRLAFLDRCVSLFRGIMWGTRGRTSTHH